MAAAMARRRAAAVVVVPLRRYPNVPTRRLIGSSLSTPQFGSEASSTGAGRIGVAPPTPQASLKRIQRSEGTDMS